MLATAPDALASTGKPWVLGDANNDGTVTIVDALLVAQHSTGTPGVPDVHRINSDVNGDFALTILDALQIAQHYVGTLPQFTLETTPHAFVDANVAAAARQSLNKNASATISEAELRTISSLNLVCNTAGPVDLTDVRGMLGLSDLEITNCRPVSLAPLIELATLQQPTVVDGLDPAMVGRFPTHTILGLYGTGIDDVSALGSLELLESLDLSYNSVTNLAPLGSLTNLRELVIDGNSITNLGPIAALTNLERLHAFNIGVSDVTELAGLANLQILDLSWNRIADVTPLASLPNLQSLNLRRNLVTNPAPLASLDMLESLDLSWNFNVNVSSLGALTTLVDFDLRGSGVHDLNPVAHLPVKSRGSTIVACRPGALEGDVDGDGAVTADDVNTTVSLLIPRYSAAGDPLLSDNVSCIDLDGSRLIDEADIELIKLVARHGLVPSRLGVQCSPYSRIGDADNDGAITAQDVDIISRIVTPTASNGIPLPSEICCLDLDRDGRVTTSDVGIADAIARGTRAPVGVCAKADEGLGVVTYDLRVEALTGSEPYDVPETVIDSLHSSVLKNPLLDEADLILLPEFAYSNNAKPVVLTDRGVGATPRYTLANSNTVVDKVKALQTLAAQHGVNVVLPLAERIDATTLVGTVLIINKNGNIQNIRRKGDVSTFDLFALQTRSGKSFDAIVVICSEMGPGALFDKMVAKGWHADLLLYPEGMFTFVPGDENMKRTQYFGNLAWPFGTEIHDRVAQYQGFADSFVYAGTAVLDFESQGIYTYDRKPLAYISTDQMLDGGYIYARLPLLN
jgi:hypothetical protein